MPDHALDAPGGLSDRAVSYLRTAIPALWGALVAALLKAASPHLPADVYASLSDWLSGPTAQALVVAAAIAGWYWLWRRLEPRIPDWLTRIVLGSARPPSYAPVADGAAVITTLTDDALSTLTPEQRQSLTDLHNALDEGDPAQVALAAILPSIPNAQ